MFHVVMRVLKKGNRCPITYFILTVSVYLINQTSCVSAEAATLSMLVH